MEPRAWNRELQRSGQKNGPPEGGPLILTLACLVPFPIDETGFGVDHGVDDELDEPTVVDSRLFE